MSDELTVDEVLKLFKNKSNIRKIEVSFIDFENWEKFDPYFSYSFCNLSEKKFRLCPIHEEINELQNKIFFLQMEISEVEKKIKKLQELQ